MEDMRISPRQRNDVGAEVGAGAEQSCGLSGRVVCLCVFTHGYVCVHGCGSGLTGKGDTGEPCGMWEPLSPALGQSGLLV